MITKSVTSHFLLLLSRFLPLLLYVSFPEYARSHTYQRGTVAHSDRVVVAHAPAAFTEGITIGEICLFHLVEKRMGCIELAGYLCFVTSVRCHHHQSANLHILHTAPLTSSQQFAAGIQRETVFRLFLGNVQFEQYLNHASVLGRLLVYFA